MSRQNKIVIFGDKEFEVEKVIVHPDWKRMGPHDLGLLKLATAVEDVVPIQIYQDSAELNKVITIVGHGKTGTGLDRQRTEDRLRRAATNKIVATNEKYVEFVFDAPPDGTELEGTPGPGDSGGPALILDHGKHFVVGVSSKGTDGGKGPGTYGAREYFVRVASYKDWILETIQDN